MSQIPFSNLWRVICIIAAFILLLMVPVWTSVVSENLKKIPENFSYSANILSLDNFYDESAHKFQGSQISKTVFSYRLLKNNNQYTTIENKFVVKTLNDNPIITIKRIYFVNPITWKHVAVEGQEKRIGYLFGKHYADTKGYYYWHVNYNSVAPLKFMDKQKIDGLTVYHYQAIYTADQTENLKYLPGVPVKRGVIAKVNLQLWIEPVSGWLVKYFDDSQAYYYDINNRNELTPWNKYSNRYTQNSIYTQLKIAKYLKWKFICIDYIIPTFILMISIALFWIGGCEDGPKIINVVKLKLYHIIRFILNYILILIFAFLLFYSIYYFAFYQQSTSVYKIGISQWSGSENHRNEIIGFKNGLNEFGFREGRNVVFYIQNPNSSIENQINIIQSFYEKNTDIIYTLTTPGILVAKGITTTIPIIFSDVSNPVETGIIYSDISSANNLVGIRNYISPARQFNIFEKIFPGTKSIGIVHHKGDPDSEIQLQEYKKLLHDRNIEVIDIPAIDLEDLNRQLQRNDIKYNVLFTACDTLIEDGGGKVVADFSKRKKIPNFSCDRGSVISGALMGLVADPYTMGLLSGKKAALILQGAEPAWLRTEVLKKGYLIINLDTASQLGISIPPDILRQADYIIKGKSE